MIWIPDTPRLPVFVLGLDLGQARNHTALVLLQRAEEFGELDPYWLVHQWSGFWVVLHAGRLPLGTPYTDIAGAVRDLLSRPGVGGKVSLVVDATGLGAPVVDHLRKERLAATLVPITITSGDSLTHARGRYHVPRADLVAAASLAFERDHLRIPGDLPGRHELCDELLSFTTRPDHNEATDDLVLALAMALWYGQLRWPLLAPQTTALF